MPWKASYNVQTIRFWDVSTGEMTGDIELAPEGIRGSLAVSANARRIVGYIGREYGQGALIDPDATISIGEQRFMVWDTQNGRVLATSPHAKHSQAPAPTSGRPRRTRPGLLELPRLAHLGL